MQISKTAVLEIRTLASTKIDNLASLEINSFASQSFSISCLRNLTESHSQAGLTRISREKQENGFP